MITDLYYFAIAKFLVHRAISSIVNLKFFHYNVPCHTAEERYPCLSTSYQANSLAWMPLYSGMTTDILADKN